MSRRNGQAGFTLIELLVSITLLSLLSLGMLFAMRVGLDAMGKTNRHVISNRRVLGVEKILTAQIAGFHPAKGLCAITPQSPPAEVPFFQGEPETMRFVSTYSLQEASRGYPQILEFQVIPGENGRGFRLIVNEILYTGPLSTRMLCVGLVPDPQTRAPRLLWAPVAVNERSFVLADKLAYCRFAFLEERPPEQPDVWLPRWIHEHTPLAVRIDLALLEPEPGKLQVPPVVAPFRVTRHPLNSYSDYE